MEPREKEMNKWAVAGNQLLAEHGLHIATVRKSMSGFAPHEGNGLASPLPKTAKSFAVLAHEVGHKALGHKRGSKSCTKEYEAEQFAIAQFRRFGFPLPREVKARMDYHIAYSLAQALNRGLVKVPPELRPYKKMLRQLRFTGSRIRMVRGVETVEAYHGVRYRVVKEASHARA